MSLHFEFDVRRDLTNGIKFVNLFMAIVKIASLFELFWVNLSFEELNEQREQFEKSFIWNLI
jgi:hypothetical protein